ncbi:hypothetical protein [Mucilaginibacter sp.]|uniref:hypothetical protein n=1 Tax=Mucilaginibacter sp. TaxID=1882438 RepID=UPI003264AD9A
MKRLILSLALLLTYVVANAQNSNPWPTTGSVGIGTSTPTLGLLHISGLSYDLLSLSAGAGYPIQMNAYTNADFRIVQRSNSPITFWTNTIERLRINSNGMVSIGTPIPSSALTLGGTTNTNPNTGAEQDYAGESFTFQNLVGGSSAYALGNIKMTQPNGYYADRGDMVFSLGNGGGAISERMRIKASGYVGIGTNNPTMPLSVNGTIRSKEVVVEASPWPDYVFKKAYLLTPLSEVKTYIAKNRHLPGLPSASEVEKDGLKLGEINKLLTKKIEELTLYLIDAEKKLNDQTKKNESQEQRLKAMEAKVELLFKKVN